MAKRRRLTPARPDFLSSDTQGTPTGLGVGLGTGLAEGASEPLGGVAPRPTPRPPIAQVAGDISAAAALEDLTEMVSKARAEGRLIQSLSLDEIDAGHLVRDRLVAEEEDLQSLIASLRTRGQQTPIEVVDRGESTGKAPRYGLISGWRRLAALRRLSEEDDRFSSVLALIRTPGTASEAYVAMVEENEIRVGLSYYERARIVVKAMEQGVYPTPKAALQTLFANVSRSRRSKIKSFMVVVKALDGALRFPTALGERQGLALAKRLEETPGLACSLRGALEVEPSSTAEAELDWLGAALEAEERMEALAREPDLEGAESSEDASDEAPDPDPEEADFDPVSAPTPPSGAGIDLRAATLDPAPAGGSETHAPASPPSDRSGPVRRPVEVRFDAEGGTIALSGPGVTEALATDLERWLKDLGHGRS